MMKLSQRVSKAAVPVASPRLTRPFRPPFRRSNIVRASDDSGVARSLVAEFVGSALFQVVGGVGSPAPAANGLGLVPLIYALSSASGAHLNPAVTTMLLLTGQIQLGKALAYIAAQVAGCTAGALLCTFLVPGVVAGAGAGMPGTFAPAASLSSGAVFGWEGLLTFLLCITVYGAVVAKPGFGNTGPLGIGLAVMAGAMAAGDLTGCIINPARALGPALVFGLPAATTAIYVAAQLAGATLSALFVRYVYQAADKPAAI